MSHNSLWNDWIEIVITRLLLGMMSGLQLTHENHDVDVNFISFLAMPEKIIVS